MKPELQKIFTKLSEVKLNKKELEKVELAIEAKNVLKDIEKGNQRAKKLKKEAISLIKKLVDVNSEAKKFMNETNTLRDGSAIFNVAYYETAINDIERAAKELDMNPKQIDVYNKLLQAKKENIDLVREAVKFISDVKFFVK
jgi:tetratricopeptide (TPR) repeat protein